jgi:uncharacterized MAPEG superfamily protein
MVAIYCLIIVMILPIALSIGSIPFRIQQETIPNIQQPREQAARLKGAGARIVHAQNNSWEALILFASTLVVAFLAGADLNTLALPSVLYVCIRFIYIFFYMMNFGFARFFSFLTGTGMLGWIMIIALGQH